MSDNVGQISYATFRSEARLKVRSKKIEFRAPHTLYDLFRVRCKELHYRNVGRYLMSCGMFDCISRRPHSITAVIANADPDEQDDLIAGLKKIETSKAGRMSWLDHRICEVVMLAPGVKDLDELKDRLGEFVQKELLDTGRE